VNSNDQSTAMGKRLIKSFVIVGDRFFWCPPALRHGNSAKDTIDHPHAMVVYRQGSHEFAHRKIGLRCHACACHNHVVSFVCICFDEKFIEGHRADVRSSAGRAGMCMYVGLLTSVRVNEIIRCLRAGRSTNYGNGLCLFSF